jgi:hypothetical protein
MASTISVRIMPFFILPVSCCYVSAKVVQGEGKTKFYSTCTVEITSNPQLKKYNAFISGIARQNATRLPAGLSVTALHEAALALFAVVKPL